MKRWDELASNQSIKKTISSLTQNGIDSFAVKTGLEAKQKVVSMIPKGAEVMTMTSVTLDTIGLSKAINESSDYDSVRIKINSMDRKTQSLKMQRLGAAPEWTVGSVHAVTEDGKLLIASNTGSQLPAYVYGSSRVIWVVGAQKITKDVDEASKRIYEYVLPLESERAHKAYGVPGSFVSKLLIINREVNVGRLTVIFVKQKLGF
ncbi:MAG: LUD domain-containing protein [Candidatus Levybacteria bacterium]|nr:LUD domain-containing protein [Candidatus Levybacteria bacterium]